MDILRTVTLGCHNYSELVARVTVRVVHRSENADLPLEKIDRLSEVGNANMLGERRMLTLQS